MAARIGLVHDVLDMQLVDWRGEKLGRVDGLTIEVRGDRPPRVGTILVGGSVLADRLGHRAGRWAVAMRRWWGLGNAMPTQIPFAAVREIGETVKVEIDAESSPAMTWERWLREHVICRIPGA